MGNYMRKTDVSKIEDTFIETENATDETLDSAKTKRLLLENVWMYNPLERLHMWMYNQLERLHMWTYNTFKRRDTWTYNTFKRRDTCTDNPFGTLDMCRDNPFGILDMYTDDPFGILDMWTIQMFKRRDTIRNKRIKDAKNMKKIRNKRIKDAKNMKKVRIEMFYERKEAARIKKQQMSNREMKKRTRCRRNECNVPVSTHSLDEQEEKRTRCRRNECNVPVSTHSLDEQKKIIMPDLRLVDRRPSELSIAQFMLLDKQQDCKKLREQRERHEDCDSRIPLVDRKNHRVHYVSIDVFMNYVLPLQQQKCENLQTKNVDNIKSNGRFLHPFHNCSWNFSSYLPFVKESRSVEWNNPNESKSIKSLYQYITQTREFQHGQKQEKYMKMDTNHVHTKQAKSCCCPQHCTTQFESKNTDARGLENNFWRIDRNSEGEQIKCKGSCNLKQERVFDTENVKIKTAHFRKNSSIEHFDTIRKYCEDVEGYIRSRDLMFQQEMIVVENLTEDIMQTANQRFKGQLAEFDKGVVRRTLYVKEKELQPLEYQRFDDQCKDPQNLDGSEKKKSKNEFLSVIPKICSEEGHYKQNENEEVSIECQLCIHRNKAVNWCGTCEKNICRFCKLYHEKVWLVIDHEIQPLRIVEPICETMYVC